MASKAKKGVAPEQVSESEQVVSAASMLGKLRWKGVSKKEHSEHSRSASAARMTKISKKRRSEIATIAAASISSEAARARALKAWETKKRKLEQGAA